MGDEQPPPPPAALQSALAEATTEAEAVEQARPEGALAPAKAALFALVQRATWQQRAFNRAVLAALRELGAAQRVQAGELDAAGRRAGGVESGLDGLEARIVSLEKRAARTEALLATLATELEASRRAAPPSRAGRARPQGNGARGDA